jgi:hypothetical protein
LTILQDELGKKHSHPSKKFNESSVYRNFYSLVKVYEIVSRKVARAFGKITKNEESLAYHIFSRLDLKIKGLDCTQEQFMYEFCLFKELYYQRPANFSQSPTGTFASCLQMITDKTLTNAKLSLTEPTQEEELLSLFYEQQGPSSPHAFERFITQEQELFARYCEDIRQVAKDFSIEEYLKARREAGGMDPVHFSAAFENFLRERYEEKPAE